MNENEHNLHNRDARHKRSAHTQNDKTHRMGPYIYILHTRNIVYLHARVRVLLRLHNGFCIQYSGIACYFISSMYITCMRCENVARPIHGTRKIIIYVRDVFDVSNLHLISIFSPSRMKYVFKIPSFSFSRWLVCACVLCGIGYVCLCVSVYAWIVHIRNESTHSVLYLYPRR